MESECFPFVRSSLLALAIGYWSMAPSNENPSSGWASNSQSLHPVSISIVLSLLGALDVGFIETGSEKGNRRMRRETRPRTGKNDFEHCLLSIDVLSYLAFVLLCAASSLDDRVNSIFSRVKYKMQGEKTNGEEKPNWAERQRIGMSFHQ